MDQQSVPGISELATASNTIRETAKWLIAAFAAIGVVLVAGSQLSSLGSIKSLSPLLAIAISGVLLGLIGVGLAIWSAVGIMTPEHITLSHLIIDKNLENIRTFIEKDEDFLKKRVTKIADLKTQYLQALEDYHRKWDEHIGDLNDTPEGRAKRQSYILAKEKLFYISDIVQQVLAVAAYEYLRRNFRRARKFIFTGGVIATVGIGLFAWAANSPPQKERFQLPVLMKVRLSDEGKKFLEGELGKDCFPSDESEIRVVAISEKDEIWEVVSIPVANCGKSRRFRVTENLGIPLPEDYVPKPPTQRLEEKGKLMLDPKSKRLSEK